MNDSIIRELRSKMVTPAPIRRAAGPGVIVRWTLSMTTALAVAACLSASDGRLARGGAGLASGPTMVSTVEHASLRATTGYDPTPLEGSPSVEPAALRALSPSTQGGGSALDNAGAWVCGAPSVVEAPAVSSDRFLPDAADQVAPWMAKLEIVEEIYEDGAMSISNCGAVAVSSNWLVTAAHCVGDGWVSIRATLGARQLGAEEAVRRAASVALCHRDFDSSNLSHDLALVRLAEPLPAEFPTIRVASEEESHELRADDLAISAGWGRLSSSKLSQEMHRLLLKVVDPARALDGMIVTRPDRGGESLCVGESGAPLVTDLGPGPAVFGVFSSVDAYMNQSTGQMVELCEGRDARSYFTAVTGLQDWISGAIAACDGDLTACLSTTH